MISSKIFLCLLFLITIPSVSAAIFETNGTQYFTTYDGRRLPVSEWNISNGNSNYSVEDLGTSMRFDGLITIPKTNTKFSYEMFKISPSLTFSKRALQNNMVNVNATVAYLIFPYQLSRLKDWSDDHNIRVGKWNFDTRITIYDDNATQNYLNKSAYDFKIVNDQLRVYFLKAETNKLQGNITFEMDSWIVFNGSTSPAWQNTSLDNDSQNINGTIVIGNIQNLSTYTEVDTVNWLVVTQHRVTITNMDRNTDVYIYKDFGVNYFSDFNIHFSANATKVGILGFIFPLMLTNTIDDAYSQTDAIRLGFYDPDTGNVRILLSDKNSGNQSSVDKAYGTYYFVVQRAGDTVTANIYGNSNHSNLLNTLSIKQNVTTSYRYLFSATSWNTVSSPRQMSGWVEDINLRTNVSFGNSTHNYSFQDGRQASQYMVNFTNASGIYADTYTSADNITYNLAMSNVTNATLLDFPAGDKAQNSFLRFNCKGNATATCELMEVTITDEAVSGGGAPSGAIPPDPINLAQTNSSIGFWINYTWQNGSGNITNSYNVSINGTWTNGSANNFSNGTIAPHGWRNITAWAFNNSENGNLSAGSVTLNTQILNNIPVLSSIGNKNVNENQLLSFSLTGSDDDSDAITCSTNATKGTLIDCDYSWTPNYTESENYVFIYYYNDSYSGSDSEIITITVNNIPLNISSFLPASDPSSTQGTSQAFNVTLNRSANVTWLINGTQVQYNSSVIIANYSNSTAGVGIHNVTANVNESATSDTDYHTWNWTVNAAAIPPPNITAWENNKTTNDSLSLTVNTSEAIRFNATANQTITTWNWYKDTVSQSNNYDNYTTSWGSAGTQTIKVNATNANGTSNTITWNIEVEDAPPVTGNTADQSQSWWIS